MRNYRPLTYSFGISTAVLGLVTASLGGAWLWSVPIYIFGVVPTLDALCGLDHEDIEPETAARAWRDWRYDVWLWAWGALQLALIGYSAWLVTALSPSDITFWAHVVSVGFVGGLGINVAHELMHRKGKPERAMAEILMTSVTYTHFCVEHVLGHHRYVSTPKDPASSRQGEILYTFLPRTLIGGLLSAWRLETARVKKRGFRMGSLNDRRVRYLLVLALVYASIYATLGGVATLFFLAQGAVAALLLETINYIEHYGLSRKEIAPGKYEPCKPAHSWNSAHRITNWVLFNLPRHADHHHIASRPYFSLRDIEDSPQLPVGYATMVLCSLFPPLFRSVMDPRVNDWNQKLGKTYEEAGLQKSPLHQVEAPVA
jgi:alkane 1-monooxygenase